MTETEKAREWLRKHRDDCKDIDCAFCSDVYADDPDWIESFASVLATYANERVAGLRESVDMLQKCFARLDSKYGRDWTEWQDVRDYLKEVSAALGLVSGEEKEDERATN